MLSDFLGLVFLLILVIVVSIWGLIEISFISIYFRLGFLVVVILVIVGLLLLISGILSTL